MNPSLDPSGTSANTEAERAIIGRIEPDANEYDALADLFLGEVAEAETRQATPAAVPEERTPAPAPRQHSVGHIVCDSEEEETVVATLLGLAGRSVEHAQHTLECVILGPLPVRADTWVMQYARQSAERDGSAIGVITQRHGRLTLQIVGLDHATEVGHAVSLEEAIGIARDDVSHWIIRTEDYDETRLLNAMGKGRLTILTGTDDVALVGAYRKLKRLRSSMQGVEPRIAVVGGSPDHSATVCERLSDAAMNFLELELDTVVCEARICSMQAPTVLYDGGFDGHPDRLLDLLDANNGGLAPAPVAPEAVSAPPLHHALEPELEAPMPPAAPAPAAPTPTPIPLAPEPDPAIQGSGTPSVLPDPLMPLPTAPAEQRQQPAPAAIVLAARVDGLRELGLRCPFAPHVELAASSDGTPHLLARTIEGIPQQEVLAAMTEVAGWLRLNGQLVNAALNGSGPIACDRNPVMHLFVSEPKPTRRLLDSDVRMHLLAPVEVGNVSTWYCTELN